MIERRPLKQDFSLSKSDELELQDPDCNQECKSTCTHDVEECEQECGCDKKRNKELETRDPCDQNCMDNCDGSDDECYRGCDCDEYVN